MILFSLFLLAGAGCTSRATDEDWEKNGRVHVVLDWGTRAAHSGVFDYYFYAEGSSRPLVRRGDASGYEGTLPQGNYSVVACNPDGTNLDLSMDKGYDEARAVVRGAATKAPAHVILQPDNLYGTGLAGIRAMAADGNGSPVVMSPVCLTEVIQLNISIKGADDVSVVNGELSGIPPEICIPTSLPCGGHSGTVVFATRANGKNRYTATFSVFGLRPDNGEVAYPADLSLCVQQANGQTFNSHTDVTQQLTEAEADGLTARIELDLEVQPLAIGGFSIVVTGWRTGEAEADADHPDATPQY